MPTQWSEFSVCKDGKKTRTRQIKTPQKHDGKSCLPLSETVACSEPTCSDGIKNGKEEYTDCGGPDCQSCTYQLKIEPCTVINQEPKHACVTQTGAVADDAKCGDQTIPICTCADVHSESECRAKCDYDDPEKIACSDGVLEVRGRKNFCVAQEGGPKAEEECQRKYGICEEKRVDLSSFTKCPETFIPSRNTPYTIVDGYAQCNPQEACQVYCDTE